MLELLTFIISVLTFLLLFVYTFFIAVIVLNKEKKQFSLKSDKPSPTPVETKEDKYEYFEKVIKGEIEEL